jgi:pyruvate,water dikinase
VSRLAEGISTIAAAFAPKPVIVRLSDFKSNEYANLIGGKQYEPHEENPMLGFRGASRYVSDELQALLRTRMPGPAPRSQRHGTDQRRSHGAFRAQRQRGRRVTELLAENGLRRGENGLRLIMMCELPTNALLADQYLQYFDGMSIGSNDLTQLTLGLDRDSGLIAGLFDERDESVRMLIKMAIDACKQEGKYIGICGQGPSDHPDFARWLISEGISSVSLNPDTVIETWLFLAGETV